MAQIRIEMDRGEGWQTRQEGEMDLNADALAAHLPSYCSQYPHRAFLDGKLVAEVTKPRYLKSTVVRF
jgi:hypothetical protein